MRKIKPILLFLEEIKYLLFILFAIGAVVILLGIAINGKNYGGGGKKTKSFTKDVKNSAVLAITENNTEKSPEKFLINADHFGEKAARFKDLLKNNHFLPYFFEKTASGYLAYLRSEKGIQRYEINKNNLILQLAEKTESEQDYQEKAIGTPLFQYKDNSGRWQNYELLTPMKIEITEQTKDKVVFNQSFNLKATNSPSSFTGGEIIFILGFDGTNYLNKLTFKLENNDNINRLIWETKITERQSNKETTPENPNGKTVKRQQYDNVVIDWSDFNGETKLEEKEQTNRVYFYEQGQKGGLTVDPTISVTTASTTVTVQSSDYDNSGSTGFKLVFDSSKGGTIDEFYCDSVGIGNTNIVSGNATYDALFDIEYGGVTLSAGTTAATLTLIEEDLTRAIVHTVGKVTANDIATLDYTIYPNGKVYLKVSLEIHDGERNSEDDMFFLIEDYNGYQATYSSVDDTNKAAALLPDADGVDAALIPYAPTYVGTVGATSSSGNDHIMIAYDSAASGYNDETTSTTYWLMDLSEATYTATLLTNKRGDFRNADTLSFTTGSVWNEDGADGFFESQGAYTLDFSSNETTFDIDGGTYTRYYPDFKIRSYQLNTLPLTVTLEGVTQVSGTNYNLDYKPITDAYFADELTWYSTLEDATAVLSPNIGTGTTVVGATFTTGKYGNGLLVDTTGEYARFPALGNLSLTNGVIEFWYRNIEAPATTGRFFDYSQAAVAGDDFFSLYRNADNAFIQLDIGDDTNQCPWYPVVNVFDGVWHHLKLIYDTTNDVFDLYIDGVAQTQCTTAQPDITSGYDVVIGGQAVSGSDRNIGGIIDEFKVYNTVSGPEPIARGGDTANGDERLFSEDQNYILAFEADDANNRGEYLFLGSDSKFRGLNINLATAGAGTTTPDLNWQFWNGTSWADLEATTGFSDGTSNLTSDGAMFWTADPTNWAVYSVNGSVDLYYIRAHLESGNYTTTNPVENFIKTDILNLQYLGNITADNQTIYVGSVTPTPTITPTPTVTPTPEATSLKFDGGLKMEGLKIN